MAPSLPQADKQVVAVSLDRDAKGREALVYAPTPGRAEEAAPVPIVQIVSRERLQRLLERLHECLRLLNHAAEVGSPRKTVEVETSARALSRELLPGRGLSALVRHDAHPQLDLLLGYAAGIPWEALEDRHFVCSAHEPALTSELVWDATPEPRFCQACGHAMELRSERLALHFQLSHLVRGEGQVGTSGDVFLHVIDPTSQILASEAGSGSFAREHVDAIQRITESAGFRSRVLSGPSASVERVLQAIQDPALAGLYYFGHGRLQESRDGALVLADGPLSAREIEAARPRAAFVFLNACFGAFEQASDLAERTLSLATAFARGPRKVVIAPLWPVISSQAARTAVDVFRGAYERQSISEALLHARLASWSRYSQGEPDIAWMTYRYFGDPGRALPRPPPAARSGRVFAEDGAFQDGAFSFDIGGALLRALKRRNLAGRDTLAIADLLAGLVRCGDLMRHVLTSSAIDPDALYATLQQAGVAPPTNGNGAMKGIVRVDGRLSLDLARWLVRDRRDFEPATIELLEAADRRAAERVSAGVVDAISEADVLEVVLDERAQFASLAGGGFDAGTARRKLASILEAGEVDRNGQLRLEFLDTAARRVVHTAHALAQQRGCFPIPHRVVLAAFLHDADSHAAKLVRAVGRSRSQTYAWLLATTGHGTPKEYGLTPQACARAVLPMTLRARQGARSSSGVNVDELFRAFCGVADPEFQRLLRGPPFDLDLGTWG